MIIILKVYEHDNLTKRWRTKSQRDHVGPNGQISTLEGISHLSAECTDILYSETQKLLIARSSRHDNNDILRSSIQCSRPQTTFFGGALDHTVSHCVVNSSVKKFVF